MGVPGDEYRENPLRNYFKKLLNINGTIDDILDEDVQGILDRLDFKLDDAFRLQVIVDGKNVGSLGGGTDTLKTKISI